MRGVRCYVRYSGTNLFSSLIVLSLIIGCSPTSLNPSHYEHAPSETIKLEIVVNEGEEFRARLESFASKFNYKLRVVRVHPVDSFFKVEMWNRDSMVLGLNPFEETQYRFRIYAAKSTTLQSSDMKNIFSKLEETLIGHGT